MATAVHGGSHRSGKAPAKDFAALRKLAKTRRKLSGKGVHDFLLGTAHLGIANSPVTWQASFEFLTDQSKRR